MSVSLSIRWRFPVVLLDPDLAWAGLTEDDVRKRGDREVRSPVPWLRRPLAYVDRTTA